MPKVVPVVDVDSKGVFIKLKPIGDFYYIVVIFMTWKEWGQPRSQVVGPCRSIVSLVESAILDPVSIRKNPLSVKVSSVIPIALKRLQDYWEPDLV